MIPETDKKGLVDALQKAKDAHAIVTMEGETTPPMPIMERCLRHGIRHGIDQAIEIVHTWNKPNHGRVEAKPQ